MCIIILRWFLYFKKLQFWEHPKCNIRHFLLWWRTINFLQVDHWITFAFGQLSCSSEFATALEYLDSVLKPATYLVGHGLTIADFTVWEVLHGNLFIQILVLCHVKNKIQIIFAGRVWCKHRWINLVHYRMGWNE